MGAHHWSPVLSRACVAVMLLAGVQGFASERFVFRHEHVLGTSLEIQVEASQQDSAERAEDRVLHEIERLAKIYSSYDSDSELNRWRLRVGQATAISAELYNLLAACDRWRNLSAGAFNPTVQALTQVWQAGERENRFPTAEALAATVARMQTAPWRLDFVSQTATPLTDLPISLNAIAKGAIIDAACLAALEDTAGIQGVLVCIGGDLRVSGSIRQPVHVVDPQHDADNSPPVTTISLQNRSLATSGNYRRGFQIAGRRYSHLLDPRTGQPVDHVASATVIADTAAEADVLATIFSVLPLTESQTLAASLSRVEYLLIGHDGQRQESAGWQAMEATVPTRQQTAPDQVALVDVEAVAAQAQANDGLLELVVQFELAQITGEIYRRPYVAIWLEDADDRAVRTALLWLQTNPPGPRWHRDLLRWYRHDAVRRLADKRDLIGTISGATRGPGRYKAVFDGKDDAGQPLPPGDYTLFLEVARERGTYQLIRQPLTLGATPIAETQLKSNVEISSASYEYRSPARRQPARQ